MQAIYPFRRSIPIFFHLKKQQETDFPALANIGRNITVYLPPLLDISIFLPNGGKPSSSLFPHSRLEASFCGELCFVNLSESLTLLLISPWLSGFNIIPPVPLAETRRICANREMYFQTQNQHEFGGLNDFVRFERGIRAAAESTLRLSD